MSANKEKKFFYFNLDDVVTQYRMMGKGSGSRAAALFLVEKATWGSYAKRWQSGYILIDRFYQVLNHKEVKKDPVKKGYTVMKKEAVGMSVKEFSKIYQVQIKNEVSTFDGFEVEAHGETGKVNLLTVGKDLYSSKIFLVW